MNPIMHIEIYSDSQKRVWDEFVRRSKNGTFLFMRDYMDYHRDRFVDFSLLIWDDKGHLIALLPANKRGEVLLSHEGLTYGGFIIDESMKTPLMLQVFECLFDFLISNGFTRFVYKTIPYIYHRIAAEEDRYALFLCQAKFIRRGVLTVVSNQYRPALQERRVRGIKKAVANKLRVSKCDDLQPFWRILTVVLREIHNTHPVHTLEEMTLLHSRFPENIRLFSCFRDQEMLAGTVIYESERVAHVQYIASSARGRELGALDYLFGSLLKEEYRNKAFFDFGTSDEDNGQYLNRGLIDQKEGFGARAVVHDHYEIQLSEWKRGLFTDVLEADGPRGSILDPWPAR
jgi:hypothetical protein